MQRFREYCTIVLQDCNVNTNMYMVLLIRKESGRFYQYRLLHGRGRKIWDGKVLNINGLF